MAIGRCARILATILPILSLSGCMGGGPAVNYVEGTVTLDGQPVEGVSVSFSPATPDGVAATGTTDASGKFKLTSTNGGEPGAGAMAGDYTVGFLKTTIESAPGTDLETDDPNYGKALHSDAEVAPKVHHIVPTKYNNPAKSGFKATVKPGKNMGEEFKFDLSK